ncbi:MAG: PadR family transcriptional regulator, regulatory protein PadR [Nocardioidaceae bacterium]|jgi:DNA-binding PadR family transcriptional regulator|nr:PadR family transcriptional regulator, regulatory protein PadR [Nocardioidaceae bacterium]
MGRERVKGHLDLLILSVLQAGEGHGYEVIAELRRRSNGDFDLPEGTVYPALHRLEKEGLLRSDWATLDGRRRRVYALTAPGAEALAERSRQWQRFSASMSSVLGTA